MTRRKRHQEGGSFMNSSMGRLSGQTVVITGGAQGLGAAYALAVAAQGAQVGICDVLPTQAIVDQIVANGGQAIGSLVDVTKPSDVRRFIYKVQERLGPIDGLVNNAALFGSLTPSPVTDISSDEFKRVMLVNTMGPFECIKAVVTSMRSRGRGKIVNIASATVMAGIPFLPHYVASKGAVIAMTRSLARELGDGGIQINAIAPGLTSSEAVKDSASYSSMQSSIIDRRCIKREQTPEDLIGALVFLLSADSDFITGQTIVVDGGAVML